jgi:hypothetical protein
MKKTRQRTKHTASFEERLADEAQRLRAAAAEEPAGSVGREALLRQARRVETAAHMNDWLKSPGLQPPK